MNKILMMMAIGSMLISWQVSGADLPKRVELTYSLSKNGTEAAAVTEIFEQDGKSYTLSSEGKAVGVLALLNKGTIVRKSRGTIAAQGLRPNEFSDKRADKPAVSAVFDWEKNKVKLQRNDKIEEQPLTENTYDRLSFPYSFSVVMPVAKTLAIKMTDGKSVQSYQYINAGKEQITTPLGKLDTIHFVRQRQGNENGTELWLSPAHFNLPVRILVTEEDGGKLDQVITKINF